MSTEQNINKESKTSKNSKQEEEISIADILQYGVIVIGLHFPLFFVLASPFSTYNRHPKYIVVKLPF